MRDFIFKTSNKDIFHFYMHQDKLIHRKYETFQTWSNATALLSNVTQSLAIEMDTQDTVHIIYQDTQGNIVYAFNDGRKTQNFEILKSKSRDIYEKHFQIIPLQHSVHFFYVLQKDQSYSLIHHALNHQQFELPKMITTSHQSPLNFTLCKTSTENIHVFYAPSEDPTEITHKIYFPRQNVWENRPPIPVNDQDISLIASTTSSNNSPVLIYQKKDTSTYSLCMYTFKPNGEFITHPLVEYTKPFETLTLSPFHHTVFLSASDDLYAYTQQIEHGKLLWKTALKLPKDQFRLCQFRSNVTLERLFIQDTPVNFQKGLYLPILDRVKLKESFKHAIAEDLDALKLKLYLLEKEMDKKE